MIGDARRSLPDAPVLTRPRILVTDPIAPEGLERLRQQAEVEVRRGLAGTELAQALQGVEALLVRSETQVTRELILATDSLRAIGRAGAGVDNIDVATATERGVVVVNAPSGNTIAAAEHAMALILAVARRVAQADAALKQGRWERAPFMGVELRGKTLGVVGLGRVGSEVARRAQTFDMRVLAYDPYVTVDRIRKLGFEPTDFNNLCREADFLTLHVPLTEQTRGMLGAAQLARMKPGAFIINAARGGLVDEPALLDALESGHIAGAGLDVFSKEPAVNHPLAMHPRVVATPHLGGSTVEAQASVAIEVAEQVLAVLNGRPAQFAVNAPVVPAALGSEAQPYLSLCESLGSLARQLVEGSLQTVEVAYHGELAAGEPGALTSAVVVGVLAAVSGQPVNLVNARLVAQSHGLEIVERRSAAPENYTNLVTVTLGTDQERQNVAGTVLDHQPRIVRLGGYWIDVPPTPGHMLFTLHHDRPGIVHAVSGILAEADINISAMQVGRQSLRGEAVMLVAVDEAISPQLVERIRTVADISFVKVIRL